ncbi:MAG: serine hydrolase [Pseudomonadota bacterium]
MNYRPTLAAFILASLGVASAMAQETAPTAADLGLMQGYLRDESRQVTGSNWNSAPYNRWAFRNVRRILPTVPLRTDPALTIPFTEARQNLANLPVELPDGSTRTVTDIFEAWQTDSIVVLHNGVLVYERYWNGMTASSPHWLASVSKSYIGTVAAILVDRGVIDRDATVASYVPELAESGFGDATVGQILDMTAGTAWDESPAAFADPASPARQYFTAAGVLLTPGEISVGVANFLPTLVQDRPHGEVFVYNSPQTDVAGWIVANATGRSVAENVQDFIWSKLGTECEGYYMVDGIGNAFATGGMNICARDMARFGQMMLNGGHFGGQRIVPDNVVTQITTLGDTEAFARGPRADVFPGGAYRDFWWITNDEDGVYQARGVHGQLISINPRRQVVIARHASEVEASNSQRDAEVGAAFAAIARYLDAQTR